MEQFPLREMMPLMIDDFKPNILSISNKNLTNNEQIIDYLSLNLYSKGASLLRLLEHIVGDEIFRTAVSNIILIDDLSNVLDTFYSNFDTLLNTTVTVEEFLRSWIEEKSYPLVTVNFTSGNDTRLIFHQIRYSGLFQSNDSLLEENNTWKIYIECDLGGLNDGGSWNFTGNYNSSRIKFFFETSTHTIDLPDEEFLWIKCNKNFYSYYITEYITNGEDTYSLWRSFYFLFTEVCRF